MPKQEATFKIGGRDLRLTHLDKILYPEVGFTKGEVIDYYIQIAPVLLPHLNDRPLTLKRYPNGVEGEFFYEKRAPKYRPDWMQTAAVKSAHDPTGVINYCLANDLPSLIWAVNLADLELHTFLAKKKDVEAPTQIVFDFDPGAPADVTDCAEVALWTKAWLEELGLQSWIKSSGSKGLQLYVPLNTPVTYELTKPFAKAIAVALEKAHPTRVVSDMKKALRPGKVLVDWSQNDSSKTTVCVYSMRAKATPSVAAPLTWAEVTDCFKKDDPSHVFFDTAQVLKRVKKMGDLFADVLTLKQKLIPKMLEKVSELGSAETGSKVSGTSKIELVREHPKAKENTPRTGDLETYKKKRDFAKTKEPAGKVKTGGEEGMFVVQKHDASHLHYDFRLAMGGVLKSWAVPKTIPYVKGEKHLAVEVEDHPLDYANFEGIIPAGQYGGGTVMVWDVGKYRMLGGTPLGAWHEGLLHLELKGKKLDGEWTLVRTRREGSGKNQWLLLKSGASVKAISAKADDRSAVSGRSMGEIAEAKDAKWDSNRGTAAEARAKEQPESSTTDPLPQRGKRGDQAQLLGKRFVEPMKCLPKKEMPTGSGWIYEIKFDGYRALSIFKGGKSIILSRNNKPLSERFPTLVEAISKLPLKSAIFDGEIVAMNDEHRPSFQALQNYEEGQPLAYYLFDLLELNGERLENLPLNERKMRLLAILKDQPSGPLLFSDNLAGTAPQIWKQIKRLKLEGIIAKRIESAYESGRRSGQWVKVKAISQQDFVIGGFTPPGGARTHFGALLVGVYEEGKFLYAGKVGTGFDRKWLAILAGMMEPLRVAKCPFVNLPQPRTNRWGGGLPVSEMRLCTWIEPKLVCEVQFTEWTGDGSLRHPSFQGMREDIAPEEVGRETPTD